MFFKPKKNFMKKSNNFFWVKSAFSFLRLTDQYLIIQFLDKNESIEKLMGVILIVSSKKFVERNTFIFTKKDEKRPSLDAPAPRGFDLCRGEPSFKTTAF